MSLSVDDVIDEVLALFGKFGNVADLGQKEIGLDNGAFPVSLDSFFIPIVSGNEGYMVSRVVPLREVKMGQPERSIAYTNIAGLDNLRGQGDVARLFQTHLIPPGGEKVGLVKVFGTLAHYGFQAVPTEVTEHRIRKPEYDIEAPFDVIVVSGMNLDSRFNTLQILQEATFDSQAPLKCFGMIIDDLKRMPIYRL